MKAQRPVIASNGFPYIYMRSVGSPRTSGSERKGQGIHHFFFPCTWSHFNVVQCCHELMSVLLVNFYLRRVLRLSANDRSDEIIPGSVHRSPSIYLMVEEILSQETSHRLRWSLLYCIVLMGWSLLPNALRPFQDILCFPEFRYYQDVNMPIKVCSEAYFVSPEVL